jgi:hypothetical protein
MSQSNRANTQREKEVAKLRYVGRQIDKFIKSSIDQKGYLKFKELVEVQNYYNIKVYG